MRSQRGIVTGLLLERDWPVDRAAHARGVSQLELSLRHKGPVTRVSCGGLIDTSTADQLNQALIMAVGTKPETLEIDTTAVTGVTFEGITAMLRAGRWCHEAGVALRIVPGPAVANALIEAGLGWFGSPDVEPHLTREREIALRTRALSRMSHPAIVNSTDAR